MSKLKRQIISVNYIQNSIQHPAIKVNSICIGHYWGLIAWILMQQVNC